jgi:hypothetical protein
VVHGAPRDVQQPLLSADQQGDQQGRSTRVEVDRPGELIAVSQRGNGVDQFQQRRFIVGHPSRQQPLPIGIDDHAVVIRFPSINTSPQRLAHNHLPARYRSD